MTTNQSEFINIAFDTVQDLLEFLSTVPPTTPVTTHYDGSGRLGGVRSVYNGEDLCVSIFEVSAAALTSHDEPLDNPLLRWDVAS
jgi:hypothetical protein